MSFPEITTQSTINIAVLALGGQGGGVLVDWIVDMAEHAHWRAQATSVAGVAQRTGATIYYIELLRPTPNTSTQGLHEPVLALTPVPGEVDVVIAAELMEAGRAVERGFVTKGRTTLIASSHRTYAIEEKMAPSNGVLDASAVIQSLGEHSKALLLFDMQTLATEHRSVISSTLFGALLASKALPFSSEEFEAAIQRAGISVESSIKALRAAANKGHSPLVNDKDSQDVFNSPARALPKSTSNPELNHLLEHVRNTFAPSTWGMIGEGIDRLIDFQDVRYAKEYLSHLERLQTAQFCADQHTDPQFMIEAARYCARAMSYDDIIRVADLKTRASRITRIRGELKASSVEIVQIEEYFHPGLMEVCGICPKGIGHFVLESPKLSKWLDQKINKGRRIHTHTVLGYLSLWTLASLKGIRRVSLRHSDEMHTLQGWLTRIERQLGHSHELAKQTLLCQRLIKGYSDTHKRSSGKFALLMKASDALEHHENGAHLLAQLRELALKEVDIQALKGAIDKLGLVNK